jgi:hypothetical protein
LLEHFHGYILFSSQEVAMFGVRLNTGFLIVILPMLLVASACHRDRKSSGGRPRFDTTVAASPDVMKQVVMASANGDLAQVQSLVERGASPDSYIEVKQGKISAMLAATARGHRDIVIYLIAQSESTQSVYAGYKTRDFASEVFGEDNEIVNLLTLKRNN